MKKVLIDLNLILDVILERNSFESSTLILNLCEKRKIRGYMSAHEITTLAYFIKKEFKNKKKVNQIIINLLKIVSIIPVTEKILIDALNSEILDYEDAVIEQACLNKTINYIISNNIKDFKKSKVLAFSPVEFLALL